MPDSRAVSGQYQAPPPPIPHKGKEAETRTPIKAPKGAFSAIYSKLAEGFQAALEFIGLVKPTRDVEHVSQKAIRQAARELTQPRAFDRIVYRVFGGEKRRDDLETIRQKKAEKLLREETTEISLRVNRLIPNDQVVLEAREKMLQELGDSFLAYLNAHELHIILQEQGIGGETEKGVVLKAQRSGKRVKTILSWDDVNLFNTLTEATRGRRLQSFATDYLQDKRLETLLKESLFEVMPALGPKDQQNLLASLQTFAGTINKRHDELVNQVRQELRGMSKQEAKPRQEGPSASPRGVGGEEAPSDDLNLSQEPSPRQAPPVPPRPPGLRMRSPSPAPDTPFVEKKPPAAADVDIVFEELPTTKLVAVNEAIAILDDPVFVSLPELEGSPLKGGGLVEHLRYRERLKQAVQELKKAQKETPEKTAQSGLLKILELLSPQDNKRLQAYLNQDQFKDLSVEEQLTHATFYLSSELLSQRAEDLKKQLTAKRQVFGGHRATSKAPPYGKAEFRKLKRAIQMANQLKEATETLDQYEAGLNAINAYLKKVGDHLLDRAIKADDPALKRAWTKAASLINGPTAAIEAEEKNLVKEKSRLAREVMELEMGSPLAALGASEVETWFEQSNSASQAVKKAKVSKFAKATKDRQAVWNQWSKRDFSGMRRLMGILSNANQSREEKLERVHLLLQEVSATARSSDEYLTRINPLVEFLTTSEDFLLEGNPFVKASAQEQIKHAENAFGLGIGSHVINFLDPKGVMRVVTLLDNNELQGYQKLHAFAELIVQLKDGPLQLDDRGVKPLVTHYAHVESDFLKEQTALFSSTMEKPSSIFSLLRDPKLRTNKDLLAKVVNQFLVYDASLFRGVDSEAVSKFRMYGNVAIPSVAFPGETRLTEHFNRLSTLLAQVALEAGSKQERHQVGENLNAIANLLFERGDFLSSCIIKASFGNSLLTNRDRYFNKENEMGKGDWHKVFNPEGSFKFHQAQLEKKNKAFIPHYLMYNSRIEFTEKGNPSMAARLNGAYKFAERELKTYQEVLGILMADVPKDSHQAWQQAIAEEPVLDDEALYRTGNILTPKPERKL